jgi:hypothetical protein
MVTANTPYQINAAAGATIYYYYTYSLSTGGEQNTSGYKKSFVVGNCGSAGARMLAQEEGEQSEELSIHPNPVVDELYFNFGKSFEGGSLKIVTAIGKEEIVRQ